MIPPAISSLKFARLYKLETRFFAPLLLIAASNSPAQTPSISEKDLADARRTILSVNADWVAATRAGDAHRATQAYAKDAVFITRDGRVMSGRNEIEKAALARITQGTTLVDGVLEDDGLQVAGTLVYEWGHSALKWKTANGQIQLTSGRFLTVWKHTSAPGDQARWEIIRNLTL
jgi:ketosteroid isomerase-like protein